ncbi:60S ribosomal protein L31 [Lemmus lemmus]
MKGHSAIKKVITQKHTIKFTKCGVGFLKHAPCSLKKVWKSVMKEMGTADGHTDTRLTKDIWAKGVRNATYRTHVHLSRKHEDKGSSSKPYRLATCLLPCEKI